MPGSTFFDIDGSVLQDNSPSFMVGFTPEALKTILDSKSQDPSDVTLRKFAEEKHLWYRLLNIHFPHRVIEYQGLDSIKADWQTIFWNVYDKEYAYVIFSMYPCLKQLFSLVKIGAVEVLRKLNITTTDLDEKDTSGKTLIYWMAKNGCQILLDELYQQDKKTYFGILKNYLPLHSAAKYNQPSAMQDLTSKEQNIDKEDWGKQTPLQIATRHGLFEMVGLLVSREADINKPGPYHRYHEYKPNHRYRAYTPIQTAVCQGYVDIVKLFTEASATVDYLELTNLSVRYLQTEVFKYLITFHDEYYSNNSLRFAVKSGNAEAVKIILDKREARTERDDAFAFELLETSVAQGDAITFKLLLDNNFELTPEGAKICFTHAHRDSHINIINVYIDRPIPIDKEHLGRSLSAAARRGESADVIKSILAAGAQVNFAWVWPGETHLETALEAAVGYSRLEVIKLLVEKGARLYPSVACNKTTSTKYYDSPNEVISRDELMNVDLAEKLLSNALKRLERDWERYTKTNRAIYEILKSALLLQRLEYYLTEEHAEDSKIAANLIITEIKSGQKQNLLTADYANTIGEDVTLQKIYQELHPTASTSTLRRFTQFFSSSRPPPAEAAAIPSPAVTTHSSSSVIN